MHILTSASPTFPQLYGNLLYENPLYCDFQGVSEFTGLDYWTGLLDWITGLTTMWFSTQLTLP